MKKLFIILLIVSILLSTSCQKEDDLDPKNPVTLVLWHNFGGQMQTTMDQLISEFNNTLGKEKGIILSVESISVSQALQEKLTMISSGDPGAPKMPDITTCYPQTATILYEKNLLVSLDDLFTKDELSAYLPRFIEEGRLNDDKLYVFPFAKSTEVLFVNQTLFNRFSAATGIKLESLSSFEGIARASLEYYDWTDSLTPDVKNDGKTFYAVDSTFNIAQVGMKQLGSSLWNEENLNCYDSAFEQIWRFLYEPAVKGGFAVYDGYSSDLSKTGQIVCSTGSTAGILFYGDEITYPDNTTEKVEYTVLPFPIFEGGKKIAIQRGNGMIVAASEPKKEKAAAIFLKWFTAPRQNMKFVASTGYLPVTNEAFEDSIEQEIANNDNINIQKLLRTAIDVHMNYDFYIPPAFDSFNQTRSDFESDLSKISSISRAKYLELTKIKSADEAFSEASSNGLSLFISDR